MNQNQVVLVILDGWGYAKSWGGNAITIAETPNYDRILRTFPNTLIQASGRYVGLPGHEVGNSEVGHMNLGAGKIVEQDIEQINKTIYDGTFYSNKVLTRAIIRAKDSGKAVHLMGIVSDGGIHSHIIHLFALIKMCANLGQKEVFIHAFTDGRDTDPYKGIEFLNKVKQTCDTLSVGKIATIIGRVCLDRSGNWERTRKAYEALVDGIGTKSTSALASISAAYKQGESDEYISPVIIEGTKRISDDDTVIFFNFRSDRTRQLSEALMDLNFTKFKRRKLNNIDFISFVPYGTEVELGFRSESAFGTVDIKNTIGNYIESQDMKQFHIAETEKYAHVTFFFNGNREEPYRGEERMIIPSPNVKSYDLKPEMSADEIKNNLLIHIKRKTYGFIVCNFANGDMVGHTGNFNAAVKAIEFLDKIMKQVVDRCLVTTTPLIITADHGNIEQMVDPSTGYPYTEHTKNPVPLIAISGDKSIRLKTDGKLANVAATCIDLAGMQIPEYFDPSLVSRIAE